VAGLVEGNDGCFYSVTGSNPTNTYGTVFKINTNGSLTTLHKFTGGDDGGYPYGGVCQGSDGYFYGTTEAGGTNGYGTVFKISTNGILTTLFSFTGANDGANPEAGLVQGSDGYLYGTTGSNPTNTYGTVFKMSTNGSLTTLYKFTGGNDGCCPQAGLVQGGDGYFYGTTDGGGADQSGTVFRIGTNGTLTTLYSFTGFNDGYSPRGLVQGSDGYFYGTTVGPVVLDKTILWGTVFKISASGELTTLYSFTGGKDGASPMGGLVMGRDGSFYGTTKVANTYQGGTVFKISSEGTFSSLYLFAGGNDGWAPDSLVQGSDGYFYGTTRGATNNGGTLFKMSTDGALANLYSFIGNDGWWPNRLVQGSDSNFYGTTTYGGTNGRGTVFRISAEGTLTNLYWFTGGKDGRAPGGSLVRGRDGNFYGTTYYGGTNDSGTVFKISGEGIFSSLYSFASSNDGAYPYAGVAQGSDGYLYGTTDGGGTNGYGTVFKISTNGLLTILYSFTGADCQRAVKTSHQWANQNQPF
jgi:uncharacterized repeat protein (TIGR03803 family)